MRDMATTRPKWWLAVGVAALIAVAFALLVDLRAVWAQLRAADWRYLAGASAALLAGIVVYAWRWRWLMGNQPGWWQTFYAANVGHAVNVLLPFRMGEAARIVVMGRGQRPPAAEVAASVVVEKLLEQIMRLLALGGALAVGLGLRVSPLTALGAAGLLALAFAGLVWLGRNRERVLARAPAWLARLPRVKEDRARQALGSLLTGLAIAATPRRLAVALALSGAVWACYWAFAALALRALPGAAHLAGLLPLSLGALALAPASAPAQPGVYHAALVVPLSLVGFGETLLTAYAVVLHALLMAWMLSLGLWSLARSGLRAQAVVGRPVY
jgi:uncharacterized protein (TIRG00374 family)